MLNLAAYREAAQLDTPWPVPAKDERSDRELFNVVFGGLNEELSALTDRQLFDQLDHYLIQRDPAPLSDEESRAIDVLLYRRSGYIGRTQGSSLLRVHELIKGTDYGPANKTVMWRGDVRELVVDAVVNSARPDLLGYRDYTKPSIDQAIHSQAGPWLREDCAKIRELAGHDLKPGEVAMTRAYRLPANYVIHTMPPNVTGEPTDEDRAVLASCYTRALDLAVEKGDISSISFCSLATGHNNFPFVEATKIALETVEKWLDTHRRSGIDLVIFDIFADQDAEFFIDALTSWIEE